MTDQLLRIQEKLRQLKKLDRNCLLFGAQKHRYKLNPPVPVNKLQQFEAVHQVKLPEGYVAFLTEIGNGGAGPFYGLEPFENGLFADLDYKQEGLLLNPAKPFLYTEPWNLEFEPSVDEDENETQYEQELQEFDERYYDPALLNGVLAICNYGCAVSLNLVVNGVEYGNIWTDDRSSDYGIHPSHELGNEQKLGFLDWYELWVDNSINEFNEKYGRSPDGTSTTEDQSATKKPWWKIW